MLLRATRVRNVCSANRNRYVERQISIQLTRRLRRTNSIAINSKFYSQETRSNDRSIAEDDDFINKFRNARGPSRAAEQVSSKTSSPFRRRRLVEASEKLAHQVEGDPSLIESNSDNHEIASNNVLHGSWDTTKPASEEEWRSSYLDLESAREPSPFEGSPASLEPSQELTRNRGTKFKHSLLRPAHIKIDALGKPVEALVMANPDQLARRKEKGSVVKEMEEQGSSGIETTMEYLLSFEDGADMELMDQAFRNIGEMQPTETKVLPKADFEKLVAQLVQGFTQAQILYYISHHKKPSKETETVAFDWADRIGIWEPESPMDWGVLKPKQKQALRIVQEVWGLEVLEHIEATGKMPIWLQQSALQLLAQPSNAALEMIRREFLDESRKESISIFLDQSALLIECSKPTAEHVLSQLDLILQTIHTRKLPTKNLDVEQLNTTHLKALGHATKTYLNYLPATEELEVHWLSGSDQYQDSQKSTPLKDDIGLEDTADIVMRLLNRPQRDHAELSHVIPKVIKETQKQDKLHRDELGADEAIRGDQKIKSTSAKGASDTATRHQPRGQFLPHHRAKRSFSWRDRLEPWARLTAPAIQGSPTENFYDLGKQLSTPSPTKDVSKSSSETHITAVFGHILQHAKDLPNLITGGKGTKSEKVAAGARRIIAPVVPHPASFTNFTSEIEPEQRFRATEIVLNFNPSAQLAQGIPMPNVRLYLPITSESEFTKLGISQGAKLYCQFLPHAVDVLLPAEHVDTRVSQARRVPLSLDQQQDLKSFLSASQFNILTSNFRTPSETSFTIPNSILADSSNTKSENPEGTADISYIFTDLEIHQTVGIWEGSNEIRYSSIESTPHGGQRQEISVNLVIPGHQNKLASKKPIAKFYDLLERVITGKLFSWTHGSEEMKERVVQDLEIELEDNSFESEAQTADITGQENSMETSLPSIVTPSIVALEGAKEGENHESMEVENGSNQEEDLWGKAVEDIARNALETDNSANGLASKVNGDEIGDSTLLEKSNPDVNPSAEQTVELMPSGKESIIHLEVANQSSSEQTIPEQDTSSTSNEILETMPLSENENTPKVATGPGEVDEREASQPDSAQPSPEQPIASVEDDNAGRDATDYSNPWAMMKNLRGF